MNTLARFTAGCLSVAFASLPLLAELPPVEQLEWHLRNPSPVGHVLSGLKAGPAGFIAQVNNGSIYRSANGAMWTLVDIPDENKPGWVAADDLGYFVCGVEPSLYVSSDAISWTTVPLPENTNGELDLQSAFSRSGKRWAASARGGLLVFDEPTGWVLHAFPGRGGLGPVVATPDLVAMVNGRLIDPNGPWSPENMEYLVQLATYDGIWTEVRVPGSAYWGNIVYGNGRLILTGQETIAVSVNGTEWTTQPSVFSFPAVRWTGSQFVMWGSIETDSGGSSGMVQTSTDGTTWTSPTPVDIEMIDSLAIRGDTWVASGASTFSQGQTPRLVTSTDGQSWRQRITGATPTLACITRWKNQWFAGGGVGTIVTSTDGVAWVSSSLDGAGAGSTIVRFAEEGGRLLAVGVEGEAYATSDGQTWQPIGTVASDSVPLDHLPEQIRLLAPNIRTYVPVWVGDRWLSIVTFSAGLDYLIGSEDKTHWTILNSGTPFSAINGRTGTYVAAGFGATVHVSNDGGQTWDHILASNEQAVHIVSILEGDGWFVAGTNRGLLASLDGRTWRRIPGCANEFRSGARIGDSFWFTGSGGTLVEVTARPAAPIANLSTRAAVRPDRPPVIAGFVVEGSAPVNVLIRAVGDGLRQFDVPDVVGHPTLHLYKGAISRMQAGDWASSYQRDAIEAVSARVGAFPLALEGGDAALTVQVEPGAYTAVLSDLGDPEGDVLMEVYDGESSNSGPLPGRLVNSSTRGPAFEGNPLIGGFVVRGDRARRVLVRAIGPGLGQFDVPAVAPDPKMTVFLDQQSIASNLDWENTDDRLAVADAMQITGAFALDHGSKDAALLLTLLPNRYTAHVSPTEGTPGGEVLFEVYYLD